jgi:hypothetical protein
MTKNGNGNGKKTTAINDTLAGRPRLVQRLAGIQYGGHRDIYSAAGYPAQGQVKFAHYYGLYTRGDVAGRIVDMPAKTTWRTPPQIVETGQPEDGTAFTQAFNKLAQRLKLWSYLPPCVYAPKPECLCGPIGGHTVGNRRGRPSFAERGIRCPHAVYACGPTLPNCPLRNAVLPSGLPSPQAGGT